MTLFGSAELTRHSGIFLIECRCFLSKEKPQSCIHNSYTALMEGREFKISSFLKPTLATCHKDFAFAFAFSLFFFFSFFHFPRAGRQKIFKNLYREGHHVSKKLEKGGKQAKPISVAMHLQSPLLSAFRNKTLKNPPTSWSPSDRVASVAGNEVNPRALFWLSWDWVADTDRLVNTRWRKGHSVFFQLPNSTVCSIIPSRSMALACVC